MNARILLPLLATLVTGCAGNAPAGNNEQVTTFTREQREESVVIHSSMGSPDIKNWRVVDNSTLIIETYRHGDLIATFSPSCSGLRHADTIGFSTMGPFELDKSTKVLLPGGNWCFIKELKPYVTLEENTE